MASSDSSGVVSLKLLIDSKNQKVLFAEAGKDFVDFLFFNVKDVGALEKKVIELSMHEGVKLLKESLQSKSVVTNVFLCKETL